MWETDFLFVSSFNLMMINFKIVLSNLYHGGPNDVPNRTEGRDADHQHNRIDIEEAVNGEVRRLLAVATTQFFKSSSAGPRLPRGWLTHVSPHIVLERKGERDSVTGLSRASAMEYARHWWQGVWVRQSTADRSTTSVGRKLIIPRCIGVQLWTVK